VQRWDGARGLPDIREAWLARAAGIGAPVAVQSGERITRGIFETIDEDGRLILRQNDGRTMRVSAGEVHFGVAASAPAS
jgi:BirA family biotin operon repressor/biotin-[acetyl-CoA-carboxylase] ligase